MIKHFVALLESFVALWTVDEIFRFGRNVSLLVELEQNLRLHFTTTDIAHAFFFQSKI